jgi:hypothetical protein
MLKRVLLILPIVIIALSCATIPLAQDEEAITRVIELFNSHQADALVDLSAKPFVFDGEILLMQQDLQQLYANLDRAGFDLRGYRIIAIEPVSENSYKRFADTMEMRVFFSKYIQSTATVVTVHAEHGRILLLLDGRKGRYPQIHGFKVM